ncbi:MAG: hypothetical protein ACI4SD_00975 [Suilimivivens sp.]
MSDFGEILVTPEYLKQRAKEMENLLQEAQREYVLLEETAVGTESCFVGESADKMRICLKSKLEKGMSGIEELLEFPEKLRQIAEEYIAAEGENKDAANRN